MAGKISNSYFYFTRKERRGGLLLLVIILIFCLLPFLYPFLPGNKIVDDIVLDTAITALKTKQVQASKKKDFKNRNDHYYPQYDRRTTTTYHFAKKGQLFYFDPNTISAEGWKKLGLRDKTIHTILNFRDKGGKFRQAEDIKKVWGLFPDEADRLIPFIKISGSAIAAEENKSIYPGYEPKTYPNKRVISIVEVNDTDTSGLISLPGIGSKLSARIVNFRDRLGGFYHIDQVGETFGLPDSVFQKIKPMLSISGEVKKININEASLDELRMHPYIKYHLANAIIQYRNQHGPYKTIEELKKIMIVDELFYAKCSPYLSVN